MRPFGITRRAGYVTQESHRHHGYCRDLVIFVESLLRSLDVKRLLVPRLQPRPIPCCTVNGRTAAHRTRCRAHSREARRMCAAGVLAGPAGGAGGRKGGYLSNHGGRAGGLVPDRAPWGTEDTLWVLRWYSMDHSKQTGGTLADLRSPLPHPPRNGTLRVLQGYLLFWAGQ